ncbi:isocitrate lyase/PEP mutase family protein [Luteipulveratus mongoliensis]|uniref:3-methyl-2-oxobutanoate hydroxymethyltransferase n=1 Tax=Luteipulveratus mongoliensis TaxID=571913 RepID=A0A0K1JM86_9MICO|nr:isocitrate lyase/phosphoenolpyruvate mutase family protein [Luteipulveratus mongoliensis]AKU17827.1 3-methyl-2-oxobutanoate hydroxymethyltransferase [Luteipulveratus mongoliensis]
MTTDLASRFHALHQDVLVLPNCWDAATARVIEAAGAPALATTSAAVAWALGQPDGNRLDRDLMLQNLRRITAAVSVPVTSDIEGGFGEGDAALAETTRLVIDAGAVGVNLEDTYDGGFRSLEDAAHRVGVVRKAAEQAGVDLFINARTDSYLAGTNDVDDTLARAAAYLDAGASGIFVPGTGDLELISRLTSEIKAPVNVLVGPGSPSVPELKDAGVRRVSAGSSLASSVFGHVSRAAHEMLEKGTYTEMGEALNWGEMNDLFT